MARPASPARRTLGAEVRVDGLVRTYDDLRAVDDVSFAVAPGEFLTLLGSSGSGKSTTLMMIAGFVEPTAGRIAIDGRDVSELPPEKRDIGVVFQSYALFPHMNVFDNVAFPLKMRGVATAEIERKVRATLELVELDERRGDRISQLSGGQQQRVALARALVFEPPVLLMDEPMGALDRRLREQLQREVKAIQVELGLTVIYVTHDQEEALLMSDRVAIMAEGKIRQIGAPREIYEGPNSPFVASFLGESNFMQAASLPDGGIEIGRGPLTAMVRPEDVRLLTAEARADIEVEGAVVGAEFPGSAMRLAVETPAGRIEARLHRQALADVEIGQTVRLGWSFAHMSLFDEAGL